jgi:hypothetical protein
MVEKLDDFERRIKISDINYNLFELEKIQKTINIIEPDTVSYDIAMRNFVNNTIEALNSIKQLLEDIIKDKPC